MAQSNPPRQNKQKRRGSVCDRVLADQQRRRSKKKLSNGKAPRVRRALSLRTDSNSPKIPSVFALKREISSPTVLNQGNSIQNIPIQAVAPPVVRRGPSILTDFGDSDPEDDTDPFANAIILDHGSYSIKAGLSGHNKPSVSFRTAIGRTEEDNLVIGENAFQHRYTKQLPLKFPIEHGVVTDWSAMDEIWEYTFAEELKLDPSEHTLMCTESPNGSIRNRERLVETMFERFKVPHLGVMVHSLLSMYASGRTTGIAVDLGFDSCSIIPCVDGMAIPLRGRKLNVGGFDLSRQLNKLLFQTLVSRRGLEQGQNFIRVIKEQMCAVAPDAEFLASQQNLSRSVRYTLPDGNPLMIEKSKLFECTEILFSPHLCGHDHMGIDREVLECVAPCDEDMVDDLLQNVVLCGGTSLLNGLDIRLANGIEDGCRETGLKLRSTPNVVARADREVFPWIGGSVLTSTAAGSEENCFISLEEFEEHGAQIVHRKFCG